MFFKAPGSRFGGSAKARFGTGFPCPKSPSVGLRRPVEAAGFSRKWQTARELLEVWPQQIGRFAGEALPGIARPVRVG